MAEQKGQISSEVGGLGGRDLPRETNEEDGQINRQTDTFSLNETFAFAAAKQRTTKEQ